MTSRVQIGHKESVWFKSTLTHKDHSVEVVHNFPEHSPDNIQDKWEHYIHRESIMDADWFVKFVRNLGGIYHIMTTREFNKLQNPGHYETD